MTPKPFNKFQATGTIKNNVTIGARKISSEESIGTNVKLIIS